MRMKEVSVGFYFYFYFFLQHNIRRQQANIFMKFHKRILFKIRNGALRKKARGLTKPVAGKARFTYSFNQTLKGNGKR